ncbi:MAG TPA: SpoIIE family protein phosphatase [Actinospica sp.]|nr:SpoIIE family protein phosphatase [Actinospica sp.]
MSRTESAQAIKALLLVVEDNATHRYILRNWLERAGHTVLEAEDGTEALTLLDERGRTGQDLPELALVDVHLPDMSGFEVCERIKAGRYTAGTPVIHVSATAIAATDRTQGLDRGADAYLTEPIAPEELLATVTAALRYSRARISAERLAIRLGMLNEATLEIYGASTVAELTQATARGAYRLFDASAMVFTRVPDSTAVFQTDCGAGRPAVTREVPTDVFEALVPPAMASRTGVAVVRVAGDRLPHGSGGAPDAGAAPAGSFALAAARTKRGRPPVLLTVELTRETDEDHKLLTQLAQACALALEALRSYAEEHALAVTLQRALLPTALARSAGVELAVQYLPATVQNEIGGDFYESVETDAGLLLAVGDVTGHSMEAAIVMGGLRHALLAYALDGVRPHLLLEKLDRLICRLWPGWAATLVLALVAPDRRSVEIANAGHIPPLLITQAGGCAFVHGHGALLGAGQPQPEPVRLELPARATLVLVTDGLIETRGVNLRESLDQLRAAAAGAPDQPELMCESLLDSFRRPQEDDIVVFAARISVDAIPVQTAGTGYPESAAGPS